MLCRLDMCQAAKHLMFPSRLSNTAFFCKV